MKTLSPSRYVVLPKHRRDGTLWVLAVKIGRGLARPIDTYRERSDAIAAARDLAALEPVS
ncbi:hypothetical protein PMI07_000864 [Rhizobium sp. CF080]|uniref:DUF2188 domain-containing protein n=1 Tax=Rhizobium sp. (strain CF080) TaxID=1144310 RepID=UPI000271CD18|nr:DUF2188 domain-containing protein [Rhizobium sp. CF080]EUB97288.1 hypothetical protein PMI07_000864 [Rhizobium sp. CF080]